MKKHYISGLIMTMFSVFMYATDINTPLFATFDMGSSFPFVLNATGPGSDLGLQEVVTNPFKVINTSEGCLSIPSTGDWYHKTYFKVQDGDRIVANSANHKYLHVFVYYSESKDGAELAIIGTDNSTVLFQKEFHTGVDKTGWQDLVFDVTEKMYHDSFPGGSTPGFNPATDAFGGIWIRPFSSPFYADEFELSDSPTPRVYPEVPIDREEWKLPILATFEAAAETPFTYSIDGGVLTTAQTNPGLSAINNSAMCLHGNYEGMDWWYKIKMNIKSNHAIIPQSDNHKYLHFLVYRNVRATSEIQVYDATLPESEGTRLSQHPFANVKVNAWEEIIIDLSTSAIATQPGITGKLIGSIWLVPSTDGVAGQYYYDSFVLSDSKEPMYEIVTNISNLADFNSGSIASPVAMLGVQTADATAAIENNPLPADELNATAKVLKYYRPAIPEESNWQSLRLLMDNPIGVQAANKYLHFMMYNPANQKVTIMLENIAGEELNADIEPVNNTAWADYVVDLSDFTTSLSNSIRAINIRMPEDTEANTYYFDEFVINSNPLPKQKGETSVSPVKVFAPICFVENGEIRVSGIEAGSNIQLFDAMGRLLYEQNASSNEATLPCITKIGLVKINQNGKITTNKVIVL